LYNPVQNGHFYRKYRGFEGPPVDSDSVVDKEIIRTAEPTAGLAESTMRLWRATPLESGIETALSVKT
jgi:hypothetical protein